jgi:hypothetical protein
MLNLDPTAKPSGALSRSALSELAKVAGDGELRAHATRALEESRAAAELAGWLLLQEVRLDNEVVIRHGLVGPGGIVVAVPTGPAVRYEHVEAADQQANSLAGFLKLDRQDIIAALVTMDSDETPDAQYYGDGAAVVVVGDRQLPEWLSKMPIVIEPETLTELREAIFARAAHAAEAKPMRLPREPRWG